MVKVEDIIMAIVINYCYFRNACDKVWGEELKELVEDRGKRGSNKHVYFHSRSYILS